MLLKLKKLRYLVWQLSRTTANIGFLIWFNDQAFKKEFSIDFLLLLLILKSHFINILDLTPV